MFEYKCTNDKIDPEKDYEINLLTEEHIDEEEIPFLKELCNRVDFYELISSEPLYYLKLLENTDELKELCKDYDLSFFRETASDGCKDNLRIKFKIMKEDHATEVGFFSDANDKSTYEEFAIQCSRLLKRPLIKGTVNEDSSVEDPAEEHRNIFESELEDIRMNDIMESDDIFKDYSATLNPSKETDEKDNSKDNSKERAHKKQNDIDILFGLRALCPSEYLNDYDKMLLTLRHDKKKLKVPSKKLYEGILKVYNNTQDDAVKYEIDHFLFTNNGHLYSKQ
jgi:hypothetical protein